ncbi:MAG: nucleotide exchange factor GrpE [Alphaproteobacteria bacterium]|nr:nucleotide exchange factor GrpE [Alphaproteobacteria bacterium]
MNDNKNPQDDPAVAVELKGVPEKLLEGGDEPAATFAGLGGEMDRLREELEAAKQDILYAKAETQNVRRRLEKDVADAKAYGATGFARDILSVADNLARALDAIPDSLREDEAMKGLVAGLEATGRELDKVLDQHGISRIAAVGLPLDPNQHQAMLEIPTSDAEPGTVVQEMMPGYMIRDRLLRAAMVGVAKKPD